MKLVFFLLSLLLIISFMTGCGKDETTQAASKKALLLGTWTYTSSYRSSFHLAEDGTLLSSGGYQYTQPELNPTLNHLTFLGDGTLYSCQSGWGQGVSGSWFIDTVSYTVKDNYILLNYPAGTSRYYFHFDYPAYQDTIFIKSLTEHAFSCSRSYHYKHVASKNDYLESIDELEK